jgi:multiple sugar transport system substrate-binding protein
MRMTVTTKLALALALLLGLTACSGADTPAASGPPSGKITFWSWLKGIDKVVDAYNRSQSAIHVELNQTPSGTAGSYANLEAAAKAGSAPDVATVEYLALPQFVSSGALQPIDDLITPQVQGAFDDAGWNLVSLGGHKWGLPRDTGPMVFYYRKDLFTKAGITAPPSTWDEFASDARKLKTASPQSRIAALGNNDAATLAALTQQAGGQWYGTKGDTWTVSVDSPASRKVAEFWQGMVAEDLVSVQPLFQQGWIAGLQNGSVAGWVGASWGAAQLTGNTPALSGQWAVAQLPNWPGGTASAFNGGSSFAITKDSKNKAAAMAFITWMTTDKSAMAEVAKVSSIYPVSPQLVGPVQENYDKKFFGGQDVYAEFRKSYDAVRTPWTWGPTTLQTFTAIQNGFAAKKPLPDSLAAAQTSTVADIKARGLNVSAG